MVNALKLFATIIMVQLFYSFSITMLTHSMPSDTLTYKDMFTGQTTNSDMYTMTNKFQNTTQSSLKVPAVELGALVFYSGNIFIDLMLNFFFAVPEMIGLVTHGLTMLFNIDAEIYIIVQQFISAITVIFYLLGIMQLLTNIRSRGSVLP